MRTGHSSRADRGATAMHRAALPEHRVPVEGHRYARPAFPASYPVFLIAGTWVCSSSFISKAGLETVDHRHGSRTLILDSLKRRSYAINPIL